MSSGSVYGGKGYNQSFGFQEILQMVEESTIFGFCLYKKTLTIARHTGVLVYLDGLEVFTVDWGDDSSVGFNKPPYGFNIQHSGQCLQVIEMDTEDKRNKVKLLLEKWKNYTAGEEYEMFSNNCRDFCRYACDTATKYHKILEPGYRDAQRMLDTTILADFLYTGGYAGVRRWARSTKEKVTSWF